MEVYVELTYCMNGILFIMTYEMISLLLILIGHFENPFLEFLNNISVVLIYIDYLPYISFLYWIVLFYLFLKNNFSYIFQFFNCLFSILFFIDTSIKNHLYTTES